MKSRNPVVLFLVDSLRPDGLQQVETPYTDRLIAEGACTMSAQTVVPSVTLPCIVSLFFSVEPGVHGITTNTWSPLNHRVPGLFEVISQSGLRSAAFFNWDQLRHLHQPGSLDAMFFLKGPGIPEGCRLTQPFRITDIAPTITNFLGIGLPAEWIGSALTF